MSSPAAAAPRPAARAPAPRGYTLLELMVVIAVKSILMTILIYGMAQYRRKAFETGTKAVIESVKLALDQYYSVYREYPPDGYDFDVMRASAKGGSGKIHGAQCLVYFLGFPTMQKVEIGEDIRVQERPPFLDITADMLSGPTDMDLQDKLNQPTVEMIDKYGNALHYDNTAQKDQDGKPRDLAKEQSDSHLMGGDMVPAPDPRKGGRAGSHGATTGTSIARNKGAYDLWSHGYDIGDPTDDITNWK